MNHDPQRNSGAELSLTQDPRSKRIGLFLGIAGLGSCFYTVHDIIQESYGTALAHGLAAVCQGIGRYQQTTRKNIDRACHWLLVSMFLSIGFTPFFDGTIHSPGLWCLGVLPVAASLLFGREAVARYTVGVVGLIFLHLVASYFIDPQNIITRKPEQWAVMRVVILLAFAGMSLASGTASRKTRKQIAKRTEALELQAQDANVARRSKSTIIATMSHETRMPMQGVLSLIDQSKKFGLDGHFAFVFDTMRDQVKRVLRLLDELLDLANLQAGRASLQETNFALSALVERVHLEHQDAAKAKGIVLRTQISVGPGTFVGDADRIFQLVSALVSNAIKFSERGTIEVVAQFERPLCDRSEKARKVVISVQDQGIGMNDEQLSRVFGQFEQVHENLDAQRGSWGLGLAIAHQVVSSMQGSLQATSEPGKGSTFTLTIPLRQDKVVSTSWSECLPLEDLHPESSLGSDRSEAKREPNSSEQKHLKLIGHLSLAMFPLMLVCTVLELRAGNDLAAMIQAGCLAAMGLACLPAARITRNLRSALFLGATALSMTSEAALEGTVQSEALWTIGLVPVLSAFLFNVKSAFVGLLLTIGLIAYLTIWPGVPFQETHIGYGVIATVLLRLASLCAYAASSFAISKSDLAMMVELQRQQVSVNRIREVAVSSNQEKDRFLARIRNELVAPIHHVVTLARSAAQEPVLNTEQSQYLGSIMRCANQLEQLVGRTIDYAVADSPHHIERRLVDFQLRDLMLDVCRMFRPSAHRKERYIRFVDEARDCVVHGDASSLFEVIAVLLTHAIRTASPGPIYLCLYQRHASRPGHVAYEIKVQCIGFALPPDQLALIASQAQGHEVLHRVQEFGQGPVLRALAAADACQGRLQFAASEAASSLPTNANPSGLIFRIELPLVEATGLQQAA